MDATAWSRLQFGFTITYHYLFPQLTMGLGLLLLVFKLLARKKKDPRYDDLARFWGRIFGINFAVGVVTGIPMEFQFGTNWARFSSYAGGVIGVTLAMEGMIAFFAESAFLGLFLYGEKKLGPRAHFVVAILLVIGSWLSGYFIVTTNAFMQHPVGYRVGSGGALEIEDLGAYLLNPWAIWQYAHTMSAAVITSAFVVTAVSAYWALMKKHEGHAALGLKVGVTAGVIACILQIFPTGDRHGKMVAEHQAPALAAMEAKFDTGSRAEMAFIGQPDVVHRRLDNPVAVPGVLSFLAYGSFGATVRGLDDIPKSEWPDNVELLYYAYHLMVGLGTSMLGLMALAALFAWRDRLHRTRPLLWALMLSAPLPYIATTAGWMTAELGRQPWIVYGLLRTRDAASPQITAGTVAFSAIGYSGAYLILGITFLFLVGRLVLRGPETQEKHREATA